VELDRSAAHSGKRGSIDNDVSWLWAISDVMIHWRRIASSLALTAVPQFDAVVLARAPGTSLRDRAGKRGAT